MGTKQDEKRKLVLRRESMRTLSARQLDRVAGGMAYTQFGSNCDTTICDPDETDNAWGGGWGWGGGYADWGGYGGGDWGWGW
jgi:hypothetical protein